VPETREYKAAPVHKTDPMTTTAKAAETKAAPAKPVELVCSLPAALPPPSGVRARNPFSRAPVPTERFALGGGSMRAEYHATVYAHLLDAQWVDGARTLDVAQLVADLQALTGHKRADVQTNLRHLPLYLALHGFACAPIAGSTGKLRVTHAVPPLVFADSCI
jgi:hypothetical protein